MTDLDISKLSDKFSTKSVASRHQAPVRRSRSAVSRAVCIYKPRRLALPALPCRPEDVDIALPNTRFTHMNGAPFYLWLSDPEDSGSAPLFAIREQLQLLKDAKHVYFNATFKVVPSIYHQLFTLFVPVADTAFPVLFSLMTRKTQAAYRAVFQKVTELAPDA